MIEETFVLSGVINSIIFHNKENGYTVLKLTTEDDDIIAVGCIPFVGVGEYIEAVGSWDSHPVYGEQFKIHSLDRFLPTSSDMILEYLSSGVIHGIGKKTAEKIVSTFGDDSLYIIEHTPKKLCQIVGITSKKAESIGKQFKIQNAMMLLMSFLSEHELGAETAVALFHYYGMNALDIIRNNPYVLSDVEIGVPFYKADKLALNMGIDGNSDERIYAAVIYELQYNSESGHVFIPRDKLCNATSKLLNLDYNDIDVAIDHLIKKNKIVNEEICGVDACYLDSFYSSEVYVANRLASMIEKSEITDFKCDEIISKTEQKLNIEFDDLQKQAIEFAVNNSVMLLTGGPGTGKTTVIKGMLSVFERMGLRVMLAAPTGRAAKRMTEFCGIEAKTIHRMLEITYNENATESFFVRNEQNVIEADVLIIDEMSMVDISLFSATLKALPKRKKIILVGDADQLPSVGPGNVFKDLLNTGLFPTIRLEHIFRQAASSDIIVGAHKVNNGNIPDLKKNDNDLFFLSRKDDNKLVDTVLELCKTRLPDKMNIPSSQIQVLSVSRKGFTGTVSLNEKLQNELNPSEPGKDEKKMGDKLFRVGDRVMQIKNNYTIAWYGIYGNDVGCGIFNGDIGEVISIDNEDETITVNFDSRIVYYPFYMMNELELAYAMTVHKSQGSEFRAVILVACDCAPQLLHRSILYTAMTRARELLIIVGSSDIIIHMIKNNKQRNRYSALKARIIDLLR